MTVKEIQTGYLISPYFNDLYLYLTQNKPPNTKSVLRKVETLAERYILFDSFLFKLVTTLEKETALLTIPEIYANKIIALYHSSFCRTSRCNKDIFNSRRLVLHTRSNTPLKIIYNRMSHMPIIKKSETPIRQL